MVLWTPHKEQKKVHLTSTYEDAFMNFVSKFLNQNKHRVKDKDI